MTETEGTVLIVDDERSIRVSLRTILSNIGFDVVEDLRRSSEVSATLLILSASRRDCNSQSSLLSMAESRRRGVGTCICIISAGKTF